MHADVYMWSGYEYAYAYVHNMLHYIHMCIYIYVHVRVSIHACIRTVPVRGVPRGPGPSTGSCWLRSVCPARAPSIGRIGSVAALCGLFVGLFGDLGANIDGMYLLPRWLALKASLF